MDSRSTISRILDLVEESGLTAKEFANKAGLAGGSITDWKTGRSKPSVESLKKISNYANVPLEWLIGKNEYKTYDEAYRHYMQNEQEIAIYKAAHMYYDDYIIPLRYF